MYLRFLFGVLGTVVTFLLFTDGPLPDNGFGYITMALFLISFWWHFIHGLINGIPESD